MKIFSLVFLIVFCPSVILSQEYSISEDYMNATGEPGDLMLDTARVTNGSSSPITIYIVRVSVNLPPGWQTCFCYPTCAAPFIDSLEWTIPGYSTIDVCPGFFSDSTTPGFGIEWVKIYQQGYESAADTLTFTATTLMSDMPGDFSLQMKVYPNPASDLIFMEFAPASFSEISLISSSGETINRVRQPLVSPLRFQVKDFPEGVYFLVYTDKKGDFLFKKIILSH